jgi:hypothetical protein
VSRLVLAFIKDDLDCCGYGVQAFSIAIKAQLDNFLRERQNICGGFYMSDDFVPDFGASRASGRRVGKWVFKESDLKVKQNFDNECTVMIWRTSKAWLGYGGLNHPGHASVLLRRSRNEGPFLAWVSGVRSRNYDHSKARYVSFWPGGDPDKAKRGAVYLFKGW